MAENLWALREEKQISVASLASRAGLPIGRIMEYESGRRSIDPKHLSRIARALYVEESDIRLQSDPRPGAPPLERVARREPSAERYQPAPARTRNRDEREHHERAAPKPPAPARASQIAHMDNLLTHLGLSRADIEARVGRPLDGMDRVEMGKILASLQSQVSEHETAERKRAYLPESVDRFEREYLDAAVAAGDVLHVSLFDGSTVDGKVCGFGPYTITFDLGAEGELTINKLAIVSYLRQKAEAEK